MGRYAAHKSIFQLGYNPRYKNFLYIKKFDKKNIKVYINNQGDKPIGNVQEKLKKQ